LRLDRQHQGSEADAPAFGDENGVDLSDGKQALFVAAGFHPEHAVAHAEAGA